MNIRSDHQSESGNGLSIPCHSRKIPLSLVLLDNVPTLLLFVLGFLIINQISTTSAIVFGFYTIFSVVWFWARICPYCYHYNTMACPCGYGAVSPKFFKQRTGRSFKKVFKGNIWIVFPNWFVPLAVAIYLIVTQKSEKLIVLTIAFVIIGFIFIPAISKLVGCKNCDIKEECPWMGADKNA